MDSALYHNMSMGVCDQYDNELMKTLDTLPVKLKV